MKLDKPLLVFDHDGTLHDSVRIFGPAMRAGVEWLHENGYKDVPFFSDEKIAKCLGMNANDIWTTLVEDMTEEIAGKVTVVVGKEMRKIMENGTAKWFDECYPMLDELKKDEYHMVMLSNCQKDMADYYWGHFKMEKWFDKFYDCESYNYLPKTEIIKHVIEDYEDGRAIMIGDRYSDFECAKAAKIPFIGCAYGFAAEGELDGADALAQSPLDIVDIVKKLTDTTGAV
jgi:phosphoglycolate phosphatase